MTYNKQLTVKELKSYLSLLPDNLRVNIGYGEEELPVCFISPTPHKDGIVLQANVYKEDASLYNVETILALRN